MNAQTIKRMDEFVRHRLHELMAAAAADIF
jgi:hypothetical protein